MEQMEYNVSKQATRELNIKVEVLDFDLNVLDEISGVLLPNSTFNIDANSDIRRTCSLSIYPTDVSFDITQSGKLWINKYIKPYVGIKDIYTNEFVYTNMGIYLINNPSRVYNAEEHTLTIQGVDLMAKLTGLRYGYLEGVEWVGQVGESVKECIEDTLELAGISNYLVDECPYDIQNEIRIPIGGTYYDILKALKNVYPNYQMYFDVDGIFHYNKIPNGYNEQIMIDNDVWDYTLIDYSQEYDYENIKNIIEVYGKTWDIDSSDFFFGVEVESDNLYKIEREGFIFPTSEYFYISFSTNDEDLIGVGDLYLTISDSENSQTVLLKDEKGNRPILNKNSYYVVRGKNYPMPIYNNVELYEGEDINESEIDYFGNLKIINEDIKEEDIVNGFSVKIKTPSNLYDLSLPIYLNINDLYVYEVVFSDLSIEPDTSYKLTLYKDEEHQGISELTVISELIPYGYAEETNEESPFYVDGDAGKLRIVLSGGEYDNIATTDLAQQRAEYELYMRCRLQDSINLTCVPIYWADVNWVINVKLPDREEAEKYIIKTVSTTLNVDGTQTINAMKYYENIYYPN